MSPAKENQLQCYGWHRAHEDNDDWNWLVDPSKLCIIHELRNDRTNAHANYRPIAGPSPFCSRMRILAGAKYWTTLKCIISGPEMFNMFDGGHSYT